MRGKCVGCLYSFFGPFSPLDVVAMVASYGVGAMWLWVRFTIPHPGNVAFYWIVQDVFGLCMCMLFLEMIKLNSIKVGAILLIVAFFYDIFFVFITPLLTKHGERIMVNVATSGGPPKADPAWCKKYPFDANCKGATPSRCYSPYPGSAIRGRIVHARPWQHRHQPPIPRGDAYPPSYNDSTVKSTLPPPLLDPSFPVNLLTRNFFTAEPCASYAMRTSSTSTIIRPLLPGGMPWESCICSPVTGCMQKIRTVRG